MTVYTDPVFPLPEPDFLWVYPVAIQSHAASSVVTDDDGNWTYPAGSSAAVTGYLGSPNPREVATAASRGIRVDAVLLVPHGTPVDEDDQVQASDPAIPQVMQGTYQVQVVRPNAAHVRVLLTRLSGVEATHGP